MVRPSKEAFMWAAVEVAGMVEKRMTEEQMNESAFRDSAHKPEYREALIHAVGNYCGYARGWADCESAGLKKGEKG